MNEIQTYIGLVLGLGILARMIFLELQVRRQKKIILRSEIAAKDAQIKKAVANLTDSELNALLEKHLSPTTRDQ